MADEPDAGPESARAEMHDAPPFATWRAIYLWVIGALVAQIAAGAVVTLLYR